MSINADVGALVSKVGHVRGVMEAEGEDGVKYIVGVGVGFQVWCGTSRARLT